MGKPLGTYEKFEERFGGYFFMDPAEYRERYSRFPLHVRQAEHMQKMALNKKLKIAGKAPAYKYISKRKKRPRDKAETV
ncbi:MAG: hypothetical protein ABIA21_04150 [Candidatus Aenigmatarchaeota archaeon]